MVILSFLILIFALNCQSSQTTKITSKMESKIHKKKNVIPVLSEHVLSFKPRGVSSWLVNVSADQLFSLASEVLSSQHLLEVFDPKTRMIRSDWKYFLIQDQLFREKLAVLIQPSSNQDSIISIHHQIEKHIGPNRKGIYHWLPVEQPSSLSGSFLHSLRCLKINQPAPQTNHTFVATPSKKETPPSPPLQSSKRPQPVLGQSTPASSQSKSPQRPKTSSLKKGVTLPKKTPKNTKNPHKKPVTLAQPTAPKNTQKNKS